MAARADSTVKVMNPLIPSAWPDALLTPGAIALNTLSTASGTKISNNAADSAATR